jgi:hypothetical protein
MFDLSNVKAQGNDTLPAGKYVCNVTNTEMKDTKDGTGAYIRTELTVAEGDAKGRKVWFNINVRNKNPQATEIGMSQLKALLVCAGYPTPDKLSGIGELNGLTVGVKTKIKTDEYGEKAEVSYFYEPKKEAQGTGEPLPF